MADKTISQLPSGVPPQANDEYIVARGAANYKLTLGNILGAPTPIGSVTPNTATFTTVTATTGNITSVNATTVDATNVEVDNVKAKDGTASLVFGNTTGNIGLGASPTTNVRLQIGGNLVVASNQAIGTSVVGTLPSTATTGYVGFTSQPTTEATAFTATDMEHFLARPQTFGAGSSVTNQYGFRASSLMTGATNNFGFRSDINEAAGRWNFYTGGTAANYFAGSTGIGATPNATDKLNIAGTLPSSSTNSFAVINRGVVPSATTGTALGYSTALTTQAASFTVTNLSHFRAAQGTLGAGSAVTNQIGFEVQSSLTGATNNYGFYSNIASGSGRYNFYAAGTADNYFAGSVGIGGTANADTRLHVLGTAPSSSGNSRGVLATQTIPSSTTGNFIGYGSLPSTQASAFTLSTLLHFWASQSTLGAGSTVTNQYGFYVENSLTGATNNYGFYSDIASGSNRWNFYAAGTAQNYFAGATTFGTTSTNPVGGNVVGTIIGANGTLGITRDSEAALLVNRKTNDGDLVQFFQDGVLEGSISVAGNTISYNPFMGSHYTEIVGAMPTLKGTVLESLDELVDGKYSSQDRLPKAKISDTAGSSSVYGVYFALDSDPDTNDGILAAALGASWVRIAAGVTVQRGDLLESNGDGCAKVQSDDIIRSKTIGKVTSTTVADTYADGSYIVPCVLYCG